MTLRAAPRKSMIIDACVLIDFIKAERAMLELVAKHIGSLHVIGPVVAEVREIDDEIELVNLGLIILEPDIQDAFTAAERPSPLSFVDWLCLLTAKRYSLICVTNDKNLRKFCEQEGIPLLWGLELVTELHKIGGITSEEAEDFIHTVRELNPKHITDDIVSLFREIIRRQDH
ncbi:MAG: PIN domain-containing protein [Armatimonadota bacterium]